MVTKRTAVICLTMLVVLIAVPSQARLWKDVQIKTGTGGTFQCGPAPSIALLYGVQPVISNSYSGGGGMPPAVVHQTPFGWVNYDIDPGYIAGDGGQTIRSYPYRLSYGQDGEFYSYGINPLRPISLSGGDGPNWTFSSVPYAAVSADAAGVIYMAAGSYIARSTGSGWSQPVHVQPFTNFMAIDLAISPFGDIAVAGIASNLETVVTWFDYKTASWSFRSLSVPRSPSYPDIAWDGKGNLGAAYVSGGMTVMFDYLDMATGSWTSEVVNSQPSSNYLGAALAFDRFDAPVIASGDYLFYDPPYAEPVPEPCSILALLAGLGAIGCAVRRGRGA